MLAAFENGRDQIIDGLEQLKATPADADLVSISDRLGDNYNYMKNDTDLDIEQAYVAVAAARSYVSDNTDAVTEELTGRVLGIGLTAGAALLALIAGVLGILGQAKVSGIVSVLAALAGIGGVVTAVTGKLTYSQIAGTNGSMLLAVGAAVVAGAAAANAVVGLTCKPEA